MPGESELVIESEITALGDDRPYYRGRDALALAARWELEEVAGWLWTGEVGPAIPWLAEPAAVVAGRAAQAGLPVDVLPLERLQVITPALAATDPLRHNVDPSAVVVVGQHLIAGMVDCLLGEPVGSYGSPAASIAARLYAKLATAPVAPALVDALRMALVLLADHELAASTLAARVAASVRADPYAAVMAGLGAMGGALHGGAPNPAAPARGLHRSSDGVARATLAGQGRGNPKVWQPPPPPKTVPICSPVGIW